MDRLPLAHFAAVLPAAVSPARCEALRAWLTSLGFAATGHGYPAGYRDNDRLVRDDEALAREVWALPALQEALAVLGPFEALGGRWRPVGVNPRFRACRYEGGQRFTRHRDGAFSPSPLRRTFLTAQLYLDEGFEGGATRFYAARDDAEPRASVIPRKGTLIVFDHRAWHDGEAVTRGRKHVLRTDIVFERIGDEAPASPGARFDVPGAPYVFALLARQDGTLAVGTRDGQILHLRREGRALAFVAATTLGHGSVTALAEDAQGRLYAGSREGIVQRIDHEGVTERWRSTSAITALHAGAHGELIVGTAAGRLAWLEVHGTAREHCVPGWIWGLASHGAAVHVASEAGLFVAHKSGSPPERLDPRPLRSVACDEAGRVFTGDAEGMVRGATGQAAKVHRGAVDALVGDGRGGFVSAGEDGAVVHGLPTSAGAAPWELVRRAAHDDFARAIAILGDGTIASGGYDGTVRLAAPENASA